MAEYIKYPVALQGPGGSAAIYDYIGTAANPATDLANAPVGSTYRYISGGTGAVLWQKTTNSGTNAGWESLQSSNWNQTTADGLYARLAASNTMSNAVPFIFNNATSNWLQWAAVGVNPPTFTSARSTGTRLVLYPAFAAGSSADYAIGIDGSTLWFGVPTTSQQFRWYGGITPLLQLSGVGALSFLNAANILDSVIFSGSPTNGIELALGNSSVSSAMGTIFSSGNAFMAYNAKQVSNADNWQQNNASFPSAMMELTISGTFNFFSAIAGKATAARATFWGSGAKFSVDSGGNTRLVGQLRAGDQTGSNGIAGDIIAARSTTAGVVYFGNSTGSYLYYDGSSFNFGSGSAGPVSGDGFKALGLPAFTGVGVEVYWYVAGNYGGVQAYDRSTSTYKVLHLQGSTVNFGATGGAVGTGNPAVAYGDFTSGGVLRANSYVYINSAGGTSYGLGLYGTYNSSKWRLIYTIDPAYAPNTNGVALGTGGGDANNGNQVYGLFCIYDDTVGNSGVNATGKQLGHGIIWVTQGNPRGFLGGSSWVVGNSYAADFVLN